MDSQLLQPVRPHEEQPLLRLRTQPLGITIRERLAQASFVPRRLCLPSRAVALIFFISLIVGILYTVINGLTLFAVQELAVYHETFHSYGTLIMKCVLLLLYFLYPLAGYLGDVSCGRYKVVMISLCLLVCGMIFLSVGSILLFTQYTVINLSHRKNQGYTLFFTFVIIGVVCLTTGFAGYEANSVQFGIDQLADAPSQYIGLFVHWVEWFTFLGATFAELILSLFHLCIITTDPAVVSIVKHLADSLPYFFLVLLSSTLAFTFLKKHWFSPQPARNNPYKMVVNVLNFARKHKYPVNQSAYTDTDIQEPSRIDFAKERYGGPFTTEQVEDVKTFLRVLVILLALGPVFAMEVPLGPTLPTFINHVIQESNETMCTLKEVLLRVSFLKDVATVALFPVYVWLIYSVLRRCIPKTFTRIKIGTLVLLAGVFSMFLIELFAHIFYYKHHQHGVRCMFYEHIGKHYKHHLAVPWAVNLLPAFLTEAGFTLVITTTIEFLSAQSPHAMKGLLFGVMFTVRGVFSLLMSIAILPFSVKVIWGTKRLKKDPPSVTNCGFGYLLFTCFIGLVGLVLFTVIVKRYKYREREHT